MARPGHRNYLGHVDTTVRDMNTLELVLGTNGRSGGQWDIWQAVYSPVGANGDPKPIGQAPGVIDREVANYWRDHYDLSHILRRDWAALGPKLRGKLHIYVGDMDNYYLNNRSTSWKSSSRPRSRRTKGRSTTAIGPSIAGTGTIRGRTPRRACVTASCAPKILERLLTTAPAGADITSWRY